MVVGWTGGDGIVDWRGWVAVPCVGFRSWRWGRWCLLHVDERWWLLGCVEAPAVFPCGLACEARGSGNVDCAISVEAVSELLSKLGYFLLIDSTDGGNKRAHAQVHRGARR